jgi:hypothetical protein
MKEGLKALYDQKGLFPAVDKHAFHDSVHAYKRVVSADEPGLFRRNHHARVYSGVGFCCGMLVGGLLLGVTGGFKNRVVSLTSP